MRYSQFSISSVIQERNGAELTLSRTLISQVLICSVHKKEGCISVLVRVFHRNRTTSMCVCMYEAVVGGFVLRKRLLWLFAQSCLTLCDPMYCSPPGSSIHGLCQARILEWVAISFSRGSSRPRDRTQVSRLAGRQKQMQADALTSEPPGKPLSGHRGWQVHNLQNELSLWRPKKNQCCILSPKAI